MSQTCGSSQKGIPSPTLLIEQSQPSRRQYQLVGTEEMAEIEDFAIKLGRAPSTWTLQDVAAFLKLLKLDPYVGSFQSAGVNGNKLLNLTEADMDTFGMARRIQRLNLCTALERLNNVERTGKWPVQLANSPLSQKLPAPIPHDKQTPLAEMGNLKDRVHTDDHARRVIPRPQGAEAPHNNGRPLSVRCQIPGQPAKTIKLEEREYLIGRTVNFNEILLKDEDVSRQHAILYQRGNALVVIDTGSLSGTFVRKNQLALVEGDLIEIGSSLIEITKIKSSLCSIMFIDGPDELRGKKIVVRNQTKIGSQWGIEICLPSDKTLHNVHALFELNQEEGNFLLKTQRNDLYFWKRVSKEKVSDKQVVVLPGEILRIGSEATLEVLDENPRDVRPAVNNNAVSNHNFNTNENDTTIIRRDKGAKISESGLGNMGECMDCRERKGMVELIPCRDKVLCRECARFNQVCPKCTTRIQRFV
eukprot:TRINITY_DN2639_c0_g1_i4.p1 TRINITY_DN2639_c0_g1~~TRINITY_DN2639_c0_g1_i4.p1  ORF type:complete len:473 (-),score=16.32 TRINITY_DN2639_c0_g1_i4:56-1474(-)